MSRLRFGLVLCALLCGGCTATSSSPRLNVTLTFDSSVSDTALATVSAFAVDATGDETGTYVVPLGRAAMRTERFAYVAASGTTRLGLTIAADDSQGHVVARGTFAATMVKGATTASITMSAPLSSSDMMLGDMAHPSGTDLASVDFAVHAASPTPVGVVQTTSSSGALTLSPPVGTRFGTVLIALIAVTDPAGQSGLIAITPPVGWTTLANASDSLVPSATASWYWKYASASEGAATFGYPSGDSALLSIIAFNGTNSQLSDPFEGTVTMDEGVTATPNTLNIENGSDDGVIISCLVAPDDFLETFGTPVSYTLLQGVGAMWADQPYGSHGSFGIGGDSSASSVRILAMTTSLRSL